MEFYWLLAIIVFWIILSIIILCHRSYKVTDRFDYFTQHLNLETQNRKGQIDSLNKRIDIWRDHLSLSIQYESNINSKNQTDIDILNDAIHKVEKDLKETDNYLEGIENDIETAWQKCNKNEHYIACEHEYSQNLSSRIEKLKNELTETNTNIVDMENNMTEYFDKLHHKIFENFLEVNAVLARYDAMLIQIKEKVISHLAALDIKKDIQKKTSSKK